MYGTILLIHFVTCQIDINFDVWAIIQFSLPLHCKLILSPYIQLGASHDKAGVMQGCTRQNAMYRIEGQLLGLYWSNHYIQAKTDNCGVCAVPSITIKIQNCGFGTGQNITSMITLESCRVNTGPNITFMIKSGEL